MFVSSVTTSIVPLNTVSFALVAVKVITKLFATILNSILALPKVPELLTTVLVLVEDKVPPAFLK